MISIVSEAKTWYAHKLSHTKVSIPKHRGILENTYCGGTLSPTTCAALQVRQTLNYLKCDNYWASIMSDDDSSDGNNEIYSNVFKRC